MPTIAKVTVKGQTTIPRELAHRRIPVVQATPEELQDEIHRE